jgi:hypothetical protein
MNNPEYILVDVFAEIVQAVRDTLQLDELNYQYGYVTELNQTLQQWGQTPDFAGKRYPLVWLTQPFDIKKGLQNHYGEVNDLRLFIIVSSSANMKASERMATNYKPVIYPIYRELLRQIDFHIAFDTISPDTIPHKTTDRYFWGEQQQSVLTDPIDCTIISGLTLKINNNENCTPNFKSF